GKLNRLFVEIGVLQGLTSSEGKVSQIYVKLDDPANVDPVKESLQQKLEDYPIYSMEEFMTLLNPNNLPELSVFIRVMEGIAVLIGFAVVFLSMYMAVLQRTREIGILKALGASQWFILRIILREAVFLAIAGTVIGIALSYGTRWVLDTFVPSSFRSAIVPDWWPVAGLIALTGAMIGALYPGWRAARQDPIEALAYE
ncbi:MAG: ABC transporter permease, partial [Bryobacteraceae bacterium]